MDKVLYQEFSCSNPQGVSGLHAMYTAGIRLRAATGNTVPGELYNTDWRRAEGRGGAVSRRPPNFQKGGDHGA